MKSPSLREAIAELSARGLLSTRAGAGIYVADVLGNAFSPALTRLFASHEDALLDYIAFRRDMEGIAAARAATSGSDTDLLRRSVRGGDSLVLPGAAMERCASWRDRLAGADMKGCPRCATNWSPDSAGALPAGGPHRDLPGTAT